MHGWTDDWSDRYMGIQADKSMTALRQAERPLNSKAARQVNRQTAPIVIRLTAFDKLLWSKLLM